MSASKVWVFFYGSFINLVRSEERCVCGIVATATHTELRRLYDSARQGLGGTYLPEAVMVQTLDGKWLPALCYIAPVMEPGPAPGDYLERIVGPARRHGFPNRRNRYRRGNAPRHS